MSQAEAVTASEPTATDKHEAEALATINRYSTWSVIGGMIPFPMVDLVAVGGLQLQMLRKLAEIYGVPFRTNLGKSVIASLMGTLGASSAATTTAMTIGSALKVLPGLGTAVSFVATPSFAAGATWLIGQVFMKHFESGGTLLDFHAPDYSEFIKSHWSKPAPPASH
jgi:uncharacterized protein (DUF697 family)